MSKETYCRPLLPYNRSLLTLRCALLRMLRVLCILRTLCPTMHHNNKLSPHYYTYCEYCASLRIPHMLLVLHRTTPRTPPYYVLLYAYCASLRIPHITTRIPHITTPYYTSYSTVLGTTVRILRLTTHCKCRLTAHTTQYCALLGALCVQGLLTLRGLLKTNSIENTF